MNYKYIGVALIASIVLSGCSLGSNSSTNSFEEINSPLKNTQIDNTLPVLTDNELVTPSPQSADTPVKERLIRLNENYRTNRFVPSTAALYGESISAGQPLNYSISPASKQDCIGFDNNNTSGGDLLSSLAGDDAFRSAADLKALTKEYSLNIKNTVAKYIVAHYAEELVSAYVCHLGNSLDIVTGYLVPKGIFPYMITGDNDYVSVADSFYAKPLFVIVNKSNVYSHLKVNIQTNTATGGETGPCDAIFANNQITWKCFTGFAFGENGELLTPQTETFKNWLFSVYGKLIKTWNSTK